MPQNLVTYRLDVNGMTCKSCEQRIEKALKGLEGIKEAKASYESGRVTIVYENSRVEISAIKAAISELGYGFGNKGEATPLKPAQLVFIAIIILGAAMLISNLGGFDFFNYFPQAKEGMSFAAIFVIGLLTSLHCIGMCGGISLSQCVGAKGEGSVERLSPSFLYNLGRIISYTLIGAFIGALGSVISFNGFMRGAVAVFAGVFMIIMGFNMLNIFPWLRRFNFRLPKLYKGNIKSDSSPLYIGLLNGLMPCGPLQAMQLYALSTGNPAKAAVSMFLFSLGTAPLMFGFGAFSSMLSKRFTAKMMAVSAVLIIILGTGMLNTGISMSGFLGVGTEKSDTTAFEPVIVDGYQLAEAEVTRRAYGAITVKKGIPVKFNLYADAANLNGCNDAIIIPQFSITKPLMPGDNIIEFTPEEAGVIPYTCWMNMIRSSITVVE